MEPHRTLPLCVPPTPPPPPRAAAAPESRGTTALLAPTESGLGHAIFPCLKPQTSAHTRKYQPAYRGRGGGVGKGKASFFQFGAEIFATKCFLRNLGHFLLLAHPPWRRRGLLRRCGPSVCSSRPFMLLAWQCEVGRRRGCS